MKIKWEAKDKLYIVSTLFIVCISIVLYFVLNNALYFRGWVNTFIGLMEPFIIGFAIAYILIGPMKYIENKLLKFMDKNEKLFKFKRIIAIFISLIITACVVAGLFSVVLPQLAESIYGLVNNIPDYLESFYNLIQENMIKFNIDSKTVESLGIKWSEITVKATEIIKAFVSALLITSFSLTSKVANFIIGIIISVYFMMGKETICAQNKKFLFAFLSPEIAGKIIEITRNSNRIFNGFIGGKLLDSLIIGIICFVCTNLLKIPYAMLISVIIGVTNIIPFFGPFIGAVPATFIILIVSPVKALVFIVFVFLLQQFDGNILGPKILGDSTGLPVIWVMFAILIGGGLFGFIGMLIGVPTFAVIYALVKEFAEYKLAKKGLPLDSKSYIKIEGETSEYIKNDAKN